MYLLGLTATPTYSQEEKKGWLLKLFPQGLVHQVTPQQLMAAGILAKPIFEQQNTSFTPDFDEREYRKWLGTHRDVPEDIVTQMAQNRDRNLFIANYYTNNRERFGKTIMFADRWHQCEEISEFLRNRGIKTGTVYSHVDADPGSATARNNRKSDENAIALQKFRDGELDVLLNVRMLTEGTDVPDVKTVFLTRGTTSQILLTQMVGRALSDTLVTKSMLGVYGNVPAFDTHSRQGMGVWTLNRASLKRVTEFYGCHRDVTDEYAASIRTLDFLTGEDSGRHYTKAKIVDMVGFMAGDSESGSTA